MSNKQNSQNSEQKGGNEGSKSSKNYSNDDRRSLIDTLVKQSQVENMGYGEDACPNCGVSGYGNGCIHCGRKFD